MRQWTAGLDTQSQASPPWPACWCAGAAAICGARRSTPCSAAAAANEAGAPGRSLPGQEETGAARDGISAPDSRPAALRAVGNWLVVLAPPCSPPPDALPQFPQGFWEQIALPCQGIPEGFPVDAGMSTKIRSKSLIPLRPQRHLGGRWRTKTKRATPARRSGCRVRTSARGLSPWGVLRWAFRPLPVFTPASRPLSARLSHTSKRAGLRLAARCTPLAQWAPSTLPDTHTHKLHAHSHAGVDEQRGRGPSTLAHTLPDTRRAPWKKLQ